LQREIDPVNQKFKREIWLKTTDQLRRCRAELTEEERKAGAVIRREEVEKMLDMVGCAMECACQDSLPMVAAEVSGETDFVRSRAIIRKTNYQIAILSFGALDAMGIPRWMIDALGNHLRETTGPIADQVSRIANIIRQGAKVATAKVIESEPMQIDRSKAEVQTVAVRAGVGMFLSEIVGKLAQRLLVEWPVFLNGEPGKEQDWARGRARGLFIELFTGELKSLADQWGANMPPDPTERPPENPQP
jgi:hypothetical protein